MILNLKEMIIIMTFGAADKNAPNKPPATRNVNDTLPHFMLRNDRIGFCLPFTTEGSFFCFLTI